MAIFGGVVAALAGCGSKRGAVSATAAAALGNAWSGRSFTDADVERVPFASLGVRVGDRPEAMVVLASTRDGERHWMAADDVLIVTRGGRITGWYDKVAILLQQPGPDPIADGIQGSPPETSTARRLDFPKDRRFGLVTASRSIDNGTATIELPHGTLRTRHFTEIGGCDTIDWRYRNEFHRDESDGRTWKSVQSIHPELPPVEIRILRPPAV